MYKKEIDEWECWHGCNAAIHRKRLQGASSICLEEKSPRSPLGFLDAPRKLQKGVPVVALEMNLTNIHEDMGSIPLAGAVGGWRLYL